MFDGLYRRMRLASVLACALFVGAAWAQTAPNTTSSAKPITATAAKPTPSVSSPTTTTATRKANSGEIYRWVDANGKVKYGTEIEVPEDRKSTARKLDTRGNVVSSRVPASIGVSPVQPTANNDEPALRKPVTEREKCEADWKAYNDSQACFAKYRQGTVRGAGNRPGSNISQEGLENCQSLPEPAACR